jgi:xylan 1,4-beta-xylosidase
MSNRRQQVKFFFLNVLFFFLYSLCPAQLVLPGDYPDPSVTKVDSSYWATATTSNWAPVFPLLESKDLIHWETRGFVFNYLPEWADYYFWAPEISYENGKVYIYYSAHKIGGNLCLGIASAFKPEGPYLDHGPILCQEVGSIDAFPIRDENGKLCLVWKEDGNSIGRDTPIWVCEMKEDRTGLVGEKRELFRNEVAWESNLVEGVSMLRHGRYFYAFYAAAGCCGKDCNYATGLARSESLYGPWEKYANNPVMKNSSEWRCPGHGTPIKKNGKFYFLYHAYNEKSSVFAGRQGLLREFEFTSEGWIRFLPFAAKDVNPQSPIRDEFEGDRLRDVWQWSVLRPAKFEHRNGELSLFGSAPGQWMFLGQKTYGGNYRARVEMDLKQSSSEGGIGAIGDEKNMVGASVVDGKIKIWKTRLGIDSLIMEETIAPRDRLHLEVRVEDGYKITFRCSSNGKSYKTLNRRPVDGSFLPPWDRAVRVGILSKGRNDQKAVFENFILYH